MIINKLAQIIKLSSGKMLSNKNRVAGGIPVYGGNGITGYHNVGFVKEPTIVIGRVGEYCGSVHLTKAEAWVTDNALYATDFLISINKKFLFYMLRHANLNQYANRTGQPNISQASIANVDIACPNIQEQDKPEISWALIKRILSYMKPYMLQFMFVFIAIAVSAVIGLFPSIVTGWIVDNIDKNLGTLVKYLLIALAAMTASQVIGVLLYL